MSTYISSRLQQQIRQRFAHCCAYCRTAERLTVTTFEFEHIVPVSAGGATSFDNLCLSCPSCNRYKATRQTALDPQTNAQVALFHPQRQNWIEHFGWSEDATEVVGHTPIGRATVAALRINRPQLIRVRQLWVKLDEHPPQIN